MLTKKSILRQPKKNYMDSNQLSFFKQNLLQLKKEVSENINEYKKTLLHNELEPDPLDAAYQEEVKQITLLRVSRDTQLIHQIEDALIRIYNHDYGYCSETGDPIGIERLLANPTATLSIEASRSEEFKHRIEGSPDTNIDNEININAQKGRNAA